MKLIIDIDESEYRIAKYGQYGIINIDIIKKAIANGTPLSEVLDEIKGEILGYNIRQRVSGSENFLLGYCAGMDKSAEIIDKHIGKAEKGGEGADEITVLDTLNHTIENVRIKE